MFHNWIKICTKYLLIFLFLSPYVNAKFENDYSNILDLFSSKTSSNYEELPWKSLIKINENKFKNLILPSYINWDTEIRSNENISLNCRSAFENALEDLKKQKTWSVKLFNSWAKFPPSESWIGTLTDFGSYDQCLSIEKPVQYCLVDSKIPMPRMPEWHNLYLQSKNLSQNYEPDDLYHTINNVSSIFYFVNILTGICLPEDCSSENDVVSIAQTCKFLT